MSNEVYVIVEIAEVYDADALGEYQKQARAQIGPRGGSVVARGGQAIAGTPHGVLLIQKWPDAATFLEWQEGDDYRPLKAIRDQAAHLRVTMVPAV